MKLVTALLLYLILIFVIYYAARILLRITVLSSVMFALLIGFLILCLLRPISSIYDYQKNSTLIGVYYLIALITVLYLLFYLVYQGIHDVDPYKLGHSAV